MTKIPPSTFTDLIEWSESFLVAHGPDSPRGVGILKGDADVRYRILLDMIREPHGQVTLLDFGCGLSNLNDLIVRGGYPGVTYAGLDLSDRFLEASRTKYPDVDYYKIDVLTDAIDDLPEFDYVVMSGLFPSGRADHDDAAMFEYQMSLVQRMFSKARIGLGFNNVSKQVEWERDDLFHLPVEPVLRYLSREVSRHIMIRHDYGLYEFTTYVYRTPSDPDMADARPLLRPTT